MNKINKWLIGLIIIGSVAMLIFAYSLKSGIESTEDSIGLASRIYHMLIRYDPTNLKNLKEIELLLRKLAHFIEYLLYGTVVMIVLSVLVKKTSVLILLFSLFTYLVPIIDEFIIQATSPGRTPQLLDIGIDWFGITLALVIGLSYRLVYTYRDKKLNTARNN